MGDANRERSRLRQRLWFAAVALLAALAITLETADRGIGISPDSVGYIQRARDLAEPGGLASLWDGGAFVSQPPLYPLLLAAVARTTDIDPLRAVRPVNAALLALSIYLACAILLAGGGRAFHPLVAGFAPLALVTSRSLHDVFGMAWSEPPFVLCVILCLASLAGFLRSGRRGAFAAAAALATLAVFTRYSGVTLIAAGTLCVHFASPRAARARLRDALLFAGVPAGLFALWLLRNQLLTGTPLGSRAPAVTSALENAARFAAVAQAHWLPSTAEMGGAWKLGVAAGMLAVAAWLVLPRAAGFVANLAADRAVVVSCATFAAVYAVFTVATSSVVAYDPIDFRLFAPVFVPLWAVLCLGADAVLRLESAPGASRRRTVVVAAVLAAALLQPVRQAVRDFGEWRVHGRQLAREEWTGSALVAWLRSGPGLRDDLPVYSNMRVAVEWFAGGHARNVPSRNACAGRTGEGARSCFFETVDPALLDSYWVEFTDVHYPYHYTLEEIADWVRVETVVETDDGRVMRIRGRRPPPA